MLFDATGHIVWEGELAMTRQSGELPIYYLPRAKWLGQYFLPEC